jgi:hypothetical protein
MVRTVLCCHAAGVTRHSSSVHMQDLFRSAPHTQTLGNHEFDYGLQTLADYIRCGQRDWGALRRHQWMLSVKKQD